MGQRQRIIIDGYNVIYTDESLRRIACKDLERAREKLIARLLDYLKGRQLRVTIVFDGRGGLVESSTVVPDELEVVFSARGQSADELIVSRVNASYIVVTSDMAHIGRAARKLGCEVIGSKRFLERITRCSRGQGSQPAKRDGEEYGDTDFWLRKFEEDDAKDREG